MAVSELRCRPAGELSRRTLDGSAFGIEKSLEPCSSRAVGDAQALDMIVVWCECGLALNGRQYVVVSLARTLGLRVVNF